MTDEKGDETSARLVGFVLEKLANDEDAFRADVARAIDGLLATPLDTLVDPVRVEAAFGAALAKTQVDGALRPISRSIHMSVIASMRDDKTKLGESRSGEGARAHRHAPREETHDQREARATAHRTRGDGGHAARCHLRRAQGVQREVQSVRRRLGFAGALEGARAIRARAASTKSIDNVRLEFDKRLEPEMRKFLQGFSRRAVRRMADLVVQNNDEPKFTALRKSMVAFLYDQELRELVANVDDESAALWNAIGVDVIEHALSRREQAEAARGDRRAPARSRKRAARARARALRAHREAGRGRHRAVDVAASRARSSWDLPRERA